MGFGRRVGILGEVPQSPDPGAILGVRPWGMARIDGPACRGGNIVAGRTMAGAASVSLPWDGVLRAGRLDGACPDGGLAAGPRDCPGSQRPGELSRVRRAAWPLVPRSAACGLRSAVCGMQSVACGLW
jgi:hypothetical protein